MFFPTFSSTDPLLGCRMFYKAEYNSISKLLNLSPTILWPFCYSKFTFTSVDKILWCNRLNKTSLEELKCSNIYLS